MIQVKVKRQTKDKMDKHLQSHSPAQLSENKFHSFSVFGNFIYQTLSGIPYLVDAPTPNNLSCNFIHLHSTLQLSGQQQKCLKHGSILV